MPVPRSDLSSKKENEKLETGINKLTELFCDANNRNHDHEDMEAR